MYILGVGPNHMNDFSPAQMVHSLDTPKNIDKFLEEKIYIYSKPITTWGA